MMALRLLAVSEPSGGGEAAGAPMTRQNECVRIVFRAGNLVRLIMSFLLGTSILDCGEKRRFEGRAKKRRGAFREVSESVKKAVFDV